MEIKKFFYSLEIFIKKGGGTLKARTIKKRFNGAIRKHPSENKRILDWIERVCNEIGEGAKTGKWNECKIKRIVKELTKYEKQRAEEINEISRSRRGPRFPFRRYT